MGLVSCFLFGCAAREPIATTVTELSTPTEAPTRTPLPVHYREFNPPILGGIYIANPGIGWQQDVKSENRNVLPETVAYSVRHDVTWLQLNPAESVYDWTPLDAELDQAVRAGKQYSFRVETMSGGSFGGAQVPVWVLQAGAALLPSGEPDYSNCTYQEKWGEFVDALAGRYDGNPNIAYIDISGYGDFNEWQSSDQTHSDPAWDTAVAAGNYDAAAFKSLDGQARRRLVDMFVGESFRQHACRNRSGQVQNIDYSYSGFQQTQLIMPFSGILQSTQYAAWRRRDVGFRYDCLGGSMKPERIIVAAGDTWRRAPVAFELCPPDDFALDVARSVLVQSHGSLVHDNDSALTTVETQSLVLDAGYRYVLRSATVPDSAMPGQDLLVRMDWQNTGTAPAYPHMGQDFKLHLYLIGQLGQAALDGEAPVNVSTWMPANAPGGLPPDNLVTVTMHLPDGLPDGIYQLEVAIINSNTGVPIRLGFGEPDVTGRYPLAQIRVGE